MNVQAVGKLGVKVAGVSLRKALVDKNERVLGAIRDLFNTHGWVYIEGQADLTPKDQVAFACLFPHDKDYVAASKAMNSPFSKVTLPEAPLVMAQGNAKLENHYGLTTQLVGSAQAVETGVEWHTDNLDSREQSTMTCLHCVRAPEAGGETLFVSGTDVFNALDAEMQLLASSLQAWYCRWDADYSPYTGGRLVQHMMNAEGTRLALDAPSPLFTELPTAVHPLVTKPGTKDPVLVASPSILHSIGTRTKPYAPDKSRDLLEALLTPGVRREDGQSWEEYNAKGTRTVYSHKWSVGDLVFWDNKKSMHSTTPPKRWVGERLMHRVRLPAAQPLC